MNCLLVIDDEPNIRFSFQECLSSETLEVLTADTARSGLEHVKSGRPDVVILDVRLPDLSGLEAYDRIARIDPRLPVIIITAYAKTETAIEAMQRGAFDYLVKPVDLHHLREVVLKALEVSRLSRTPALIGEEAPEDVTADRLVGHSPAMQEVYKEIGRVASQDATVLILGESGTGKELVARAIYNHSHRSHKPFLAINCAALPDSLLESELFGHEKGAFTGADHRRIGKFEQVNGGTIFLDEIGDMSPAIQAKALRLLQQQQFERVGGTTTLQTDVRIIAATNQNLPQLIAEGRFRQDLYYRLNGFTIQLPPLHERRDDVPRLVEYFIHRFSRELNRNVATITSEAMEILSRYNWPGNVRELASAVRYAIVHAAGDVITADCIPEACRTDSPPEIAAAGGFDVAAYVRNLLAQGAHDIYARVSADVDRVVIQEVMNHVGGSQVQAAERLGIARMTLRAKLRAQQMMMDRSNQTG